MTLAPAIRALLVGHDVDDVYELGRRFENDELGPLSLARTGSLDGARSALGSATFDLILLDLGLADAATLKELRRLAAHVPILVLGEQRDASLASALLERGAQDFLVKAEVRHSLGLALHYALARWQAQELARYPAENPSPVMRVSHDGVVLHGNAASDVLLAAWRTGLGERIPENLRAVVAGACTSGKTVLVDVECSDRVFALSIAPVVERGYANIYGQDVTEHRAAEARYRFLYTNMLAGCARCQLLYRDGAACDYVYLEVNETFRELTGLRDVEGRRASELLPGLHTTNPEILEICSRVAASGVPERFETFVSQLGQWFAVSVYSPAPEHFVAVFDLITERKRAESALKASEARYRLLAENASDVIWTMGLDERLSYVSPSWERLTGFSVAETLEMPSVRRIMSAASFEQVQFVLAEELGTPGLNPRGRVLEVELLKKDGSSLWVEVKASLIREADGTPTGVVGVTRDISEKRALRASIAQADRLASMGMLAAGVAHEINNPLAYVLYDLESVLEDLPPARDPDDIPTRVREALDGARRIKEISRALGTFSRVESAQVHPVDLRDAIKHAISMAQNEFKYRARLVAELDAVAEVVASEGKLAQVFLNLLVNAAHSIDEGDAEHNEIGVRTWVENDHVVAEVRDTGKGISPDHAERVFEPFFTTKDVGMGSGLGLAICKNIVQGFGGQISFQSERGTGTTFRIVLPRPKLDAPALPHTTHRPSASQKGRILVIDDEVAVARALTRMLGDEHRVTTAASGEEACELLERDSQFDVILCDLMMPSMTGMELYDWLSAREPELVGKIVFVSGGAFTPRARDFLASVPNPRLEKPFDGKTVRQVVAAVLEENVG